MLRKQERKAEGKHALKSDRQLISHFKWTQRGNITFKGSCVAGPAMRAALLQTSLTGGGTAAQSHTFLRLSLCLHHPLLSARPAPTSSLFAQLVLHCPGTYVRAPRVVVRPMF